MPASSGPIQLDRLKTVNIAVSQIGTKEEYTNGGKQVNLYLKSVGLGGGFYWCAAFVKWVYNLAGVKTPNGANGAARSFFEQGRNVYQRGGAGSIEAVQPGDCVGYYYPNLGRIGHIGLVEKNQPGVLITIEGNTSEGQSRNGDGVHRLRRMKRSIYVAADYISK